MKSEIRTILLGIGQFLFCALLSASAYGLYVLNLRVSVPVESLIELGQEALLLSAAIFTLRTASLEKALSGGLWLVGGFLSRSSSGSSTVGSATPGSTASSSGSAVSPGP